MRFQPSQEVKNFISLFPDLLDLDFDLWPPWYRVDVGKVPEDFRMAQLKDWEVTCPKLVSVSFLDGLIYQKMGSSEWLDIVF